MPHPLLIKKNNFKIKNEKIGFDPRLFNENFIKKFSNKLGIKCVAINTNLVKLIKEKKTHFKKKKKWWGFGPIGIASWKKLSISLKKWRFELAVSPPSQCPRFSEQMRFIELNKGFPKQIILVL